MTEKRFRVFKFPDVDKFGVSDDIAEVTVAFCDEKWEADSLCDLLNELHDENEKLKTQLMENNCDNCKYSKAIYADVECRKKGLTEWKYNCDEFKGDME